ncbi:hypothetical protein BGW38_001076 [Lunasporangiospora selenospora]|uniref:N-acetyltransferase domain-containing protein n=1 Tax=Lunasporangiospora selenospora TaxID=979761 RepID=A0A9P6FV71_9FUNG|nr:hypothetical protein BGW38_001076 [Lunasporangiospora selenospora]
MASPSSSVSSSESSGPSTPRPERKNDVFVRLAQTEDEKYLAQFHSVINKAYRTEGGWTTESHLVQDERISQDGLRELLNDKVNPLLLAFDSNTMEPLGTLQLEPLEHYPSFGEYQGENYSPTYVESHKKEQQIVLGLFSVDPTQQSRGIGRKLVEFALRHAKETMGRKQALVYVIVQRPELIGWYKRLGFTDFGEKLPFPDAFRLLQNDVHFSVLRLEL